MDKWILGFFRWFTPLLTKRGLDTDRIMVIVETKLKLDKRRSYIQNARINQKKEKESANHLLLVLIIYAIFSLFMALMIAGLNNLTLSMIFFHAYILVMMAMTLITDFSSVLLDTTDNQIILPRPISGKTIFIARMIHISIYLLQFAIAMCTLPIIAIFWFYGIPAGAASIITSLSSILLAVFFTFLLYMGILRYASEQKLKDIITYFQIFMTILFAGGYQLLPRLINLSAVTTSFQLKPYAYMAPPVWMAVSISAIHEGTYDLLHLSMMALATILPPLLCWILLKYLAPTFSGKLAMINSDAGRVQASEDIKGKPGLTLSEKLSVLLCKTSTESAAFRMTWKITGRDKQFRLQFYPSIGYIFIFLLIVIFERDRDVSTLWSSLPASKHFLWAIYSPMIMILTASVLISYHENYQASWVYYSSPLSRPGLLISGALKAIFVKYCLPVYLFFLTISLFIWGPSVIDDFIAGLLMLVSCLFFSVGLSKKHLPFSQQPNTQQQSGRWLRTILQFIVIGLMIGLHYIALVFPLMLYVFIPLAALACWLLVTHIQRTEWRAIYQ